MFNIGGGEIVIIVVVALLVLGPDKLPRFMRTIGKGIGDLRRATTDLQQSIHLELEEKEKPQAVKQESAASALPQQSSAETVSPRRTSRIRATPLRRKPSPGAKR